MAKKIRIVGTSAKKVQILNQAKPRIDATELALGLGAAPCGEKASGFLDPIALAELGTQLLRRLRSSGGRPALADATEICRVPLCAEDVHMLETMAAEIGESGVAKPSVGQLASVIVHRYLAELAPAKNACLPPSV
jgi:hypothetical protein